MSGAVELRTYVAILHRRKWLVATTAAVALLVSIIGAALLPPAYEATTTLRVTTPTDPSDRVSYDSVMYAGRLANTYARIALSDSALAELASRVGRRDPPKARIDVPANTELLQITVEDHDPVLAADAANALAQILVARATSMSGANARSTREALGAQVAQLEAELAQPDASPTPASDSDRPDATLSSDRSRQLKQDRYARLLDQYEHAKATEQAWATAVTVLEPATVPDVPTRPKRSLIVAVALALGLVGGAGLAFLFEHLDTRLHSTRRVEEAAGLPILGAVPVAGEREDGGLFAADSRESEAFRRIRTHIAALEGAAPRSLLVTSAEVGEGKSTVAANLASLMAEAGQRVVLVDADLRLPTVHTILNLPNSLGLSGVLNRGDTWDQVIQKTRRRNVWVITSGPTPSNPGALVGSARMRELMGQLGGWFDVVLVDSPALLAVADAAALATLVEAVILVVSRSQTRREAMQAASSELVGVQAKLLGLVVNRAEPSRDYGYYARTGDTPRQEGIEGDRSHGESRGQYVAS